MLRGQLVSEVGALRSRTAPDRVILLAPTENAHIPYYHPKASAIAIWRRFPSKFDGMHLILWWGKVWYAI